jgi:hypothetical protein
MAKNLLTISVFVLTFTLLLLPTTLAVPISAVTNKIIYAIGDTLTITGTVNATGSVEIIAKIYNSTTLMNTTTTNSSVSLNSFTIINEINDSYTPGGYFVNITAGEDTIKMSFKVVSSIIYLEPHLIGDPNKTFPISTTTRITEDNADYLGGNFSELVSLSKNTTKAVYYGNASIPLSSGNKTYHFVLVDENSPESFDKLYLDDDVNFLIYNTSEDVGDEWEPEKIKKIGEGIKFNGTYEYIVSYIDFVNGNKVVLSKPIDSSAYSPGNPIYFVIMSKDSAGGIQPNQPFEVKFINSTGHVVYTITNTTDESGLFVSNFTAPQASGWGVINVNDSLGLEFFSVETFKLYGKITDLLDNPTCTFSPNSKVKISATVKNASDQPIETPDEIYAVVKYPNGTSQQVNLTGGNGTFTRELYPGSLQGEYGVKIVAKVGQDVQEFSTGFAVKSVMAEVMAINPQFLSEGGKESFVSSFAPNSNVSLLVTLSDVEKGGLFAQGPEGGGTIDIDDKNTAVDECESLVSILSIQDERGKDITSTISYQVMNLSRFVSSIGKPPDEGPPPSMLRQCMIVFTAPNRTGIYRVKVNVKYNGDNLAGTTFAIQKYYATANPVDFTGEKDFWFYAPNSTIYIKLKVTDLTTREELNASKIVDAKIFEMARQWPSYQDMLTGSYKPNEAIVPGKGIINFTTPDSEGFFDFKFKFKTEEGEEGLGTGFFMLKKYMIWGEPVCGGEGHCMFAPGKNVTLNVKIIPISDADKLSKGMKDLSQIGYCSDCDGLIVSVNSIWSDQLMKQIPASDYTVYNGTIFNSTTNTTIEPKNMPTGVFGVDLIVTDPTNPTKQYIGWAGFEIRRLLIITDHLKVDDQGNITVKQQEGMWGTTSFSLGQDVLFGVQAMNPANFTPIPIQTVTVETVTLMSEMGPPIALKEGVHYKWAAEEKQVQGRGQMYVVNVTGLNKTGSIRITFKVTTSQASDTWSYWLQMSRYIIETEYRGMNQWPPTFAPDENLTVNVTAFEADESPHELSGQGTRLKMINKMEADIRMKLNSSTKCDGGKCTIDIYCVNDLSCLGSGEFRAIIAVNDTNGIQTEEEVFFAIKGLSVTIPSIESFWVGREDSPTKEIELRNDMDRCNNEKWLNSDWLSQNFHDLNKGFVGDDSLNDDTCSGETTTVCIWNSQQNFTINFTKNENTKATAHCVYPNGTWSGISPNCAGNGNYTYIVSNSTHIWVKINGSEENPANMTGIEPITEGGNFEASGITWYVWKIGKKWENNNWVNYPQGYLITAENFFELQGFPNHFNCSNPISLRFDVTKTHPENFGGVFCILNQTMEVASSCNNGQPQDIQNRSALYWASGPCPPGKGNTVFVYSNTTHVWINESANLIQTPPLINGSLFTIGGREWKVSSIGKTQQGGTQLNMINIIVNDVVRICQGPDCEPYFDLIISEKYQDNLGGRFCVRQNGEWSDMFGECDGNISYVYSNTTHVWINASSDLTNTQAKAENQTFDFANRTWKIVNLEENKFRVKLAGNKICGEMDNPECQGPSCQPIIYEMELPGEYSSNYHAYINNLIDNWITQDPNFAPFNDSRPIYIYHNTTHVWVSNKTNMSDVNPAGINEILADPYGGQWKVKMINKRSLKLEGQNVLAETGAFINTSYSKSGIIRIEPVREEWLGGWDQMTGKSRGLDLDGDGFTNGTVYVAVADNAVKGIYDTFFFSKTNNFSTPISVNANPEQRKFGYGKLTLLSISSVSGVQVKAYSNQPSDWAELGEFKVGSVVRVPVIVKKPSGDDGVANVSVYLIKREISGQPSQFISLPSPPNSIINGIGEIVVNFTALGLNQSGQYAFGIRAVNESAEEKLEEWKWPRATMRTFLVDSVVGDGGYIGPFMQLPLYRYDWETYGSWIPEIRTETITGINKTFEGVFARGWERDRLQCPNLVEPSEAGEGQNWTFALDSPLNYYLYVNSQNESKVWIKQGDCNFTNALLRSEGEQVNLTWDNHKYMLYVLYVNTTEQGRDVIIGVAGVNSSEIQPIRIDGNMLRWRLMALNISGTLYDVLLANSSEDYPMCNIWNMGECAKVAWFSTTGNFSGLNSTAIGQNFASDLYLAKIGPSSWDGLIIGNFSQISSLGLPGVDVRPMDNTPSYFAKLNESVLGLDLNKNGNDDVFYALAFDEKDDSLHELTGVIVDDDSNITSEWWANFSGNSSLPGYYKDFYGDETGIREMRSSLPKGVWSGNIRFNESENMPYEQSPQWDIVLYNNTHMLLRKWKWWFAPNEDITLILKTFEFNQSGIPNVNVTIDKLMYYGSGFPTLLQPVQDYNITGSDTTNVDGYVVMKITRDNDWQPGQYNVRIRASTENRVETTDNWFNIQP